MYNNIYIYIIYNIYIYIYIYIYMYVYIIDTLLNILLKKSISYKRIREFCWKITTSEISHERWYCYFCNILMKN